MPVLASDSAINSADSCPSIRRATNSPSEVTNGLMTCCSTNAAADTPKTASSDRQAADPVPCAIAAGRRPKTTLVENTNTSGSRPSSRFAVTSTDTSPPPARGTSAMIRSREPASSRTFVKEVSATVDHPAHDQIIAVKRQPGNRLGPVRHVRAEFTGARGGAGPLTVGQARALSWVADTTQPTRMIDWILGLPPGAVLDDVIAAWRVLMARHEALRTSYPPGPKPVQGVRRSGELVIDVYEAGPQPAEIWPDLTAELARRLRSTEFDVTTELPVRVGGALANGVPRSAVVVLSHVAVDFGSMELLGREFSALAANPASADLPPAGHQPLDRPADERSPRGRSRADAALRSWRHQLERMPQCLYAVPYGAGSYRPEPAEFELRSAAGALALRHIAARTGATKSTAVLAALGAVLSWRTGHDECAFPVVVSNRYGRHLHGYVGPIARSGLLSLAVSGRSFDELVQAAATAMLRAGRSALVDHAELVKAFARAEYDRGIAFRRACVVNDVSVYWARPEAAQALPSATEGKDALRETCFARAEAAEG